MLNEKYEKLQKEIHQKINFEKNKINQILKSPMPFRGGWSEITSSSGGILSTRNQGKKHTVHDFAQRNTNMFGPPSSEETSRRPNSRFRQQSSLQYPAQSIKQELPQNQPGNPYGNKNMISQLKTQIQDGIDSAWLPLVNNNSNQSDHHMRRTQNAKFNSNSFVQSPQHHGVAISTSNMQTQRLSLGQRVSRPNNSLIT